MAKLSFLEGLDEALEQGRVSIVAAPPASAVNALPGSVGHEKTELEQVDERLRAIENDLFDDALQVSADMLAFRELDPSALKDVPPEWVERYGLERAQRRHRVASASWMKSSEAPVALKHAAVLAVGIIRSRASQKASPRSLNISIVQLTEQPQHGFRELEVEK